MIPEGDYSKFNSSLKRNKTIFLSQSFTWHGIIQRVRIQSTNQIFLRKIQNRQFLVNIVNEQSFFFYLDIL